MNRLLLFLIIIPLGLAGCTRSNRTDDISAPPTVDYGTSMITMGSTIAVTNDPIWKESPSLSTKITPTRTPIPRGATPATPSAKTRSPAETLVTRTGTPPPTPTTKLPGGVPEKVWKDIPIMPGAVTGEENEDRYRFMLKATVDQVEEFYMTELGKLGWKFNAKGTGENGAPIFIFSAPGKILSISVMVIGDIVVVSLAPI